MSDDMLNKEQYKNGAESPDPDTPQNNSKAGCIAGAAVILFFIAELIALAVFSQTNPILCVPCVGLLFLVFGIIALVQTKITWDTYPVIIFPFVGFLMIVLPLADFLSRQRTGETIFTTELISGMVSVVMFLAGVLMIVMPRLKRKAMLNVCTETVLAKCIALDSHISHGKHRSTRVYAPKWEYFIGGTFYEHQENTYTNVNVPKIGDLTEILVNPDDPNQIYRHNPSVLLITTIMGIVCIGMGVLTVYAVFFLE